MISVSENFERFLLRRLCEDERFQKTYLPHLNETYFGDSVFRQKILSLIKSYVRDNGMAPSGEFLYEKALRLDSSYKEGVLEELEEVLQTDMGISTQEADNLIREFIFDRALRDALDESIDLYEEQAFDKIREKIDRVFALGKLQTSSGLSYFQIEERMKLQSISSSRVGSLWPKLNRAIRGGLGIGELGLILAPPKSKKTQVLLHLALASVINQAPTAYYSLEVSEQIIVSRLDALLTGKSKDDCEDDIHLNDAEAAARIRRLGKMIKVPLYIKQLPSRKTTLDDIREDLYNFEARTGCKVETVFIDYLDLCRPSRFYKEMRFGFTELFTDARGWAIEDKFRLWTASQTNRGGKNKETVEGTDVGEDYQKIAIVDLAITLNQTNEERDSHVLRLHVADARNVEGGRSVNLDIDPTTFRLKEMTS